MHARSTPCASAWAGAQKNVMKFGHDPPLQLGQAAEPRPQTTLVARRERLGLDALAIDQLRGGSAPREAQVPVAGLQCFARELALRRARGRAVGRGSLDLTLSSSSEPSSVVNGPGARGPTGLPHCVPLGIRSVAIARQQMGRSFRACRHGSQSPIDHPPEDALDDGTVSPGFQVTPGEILAPS